MSLPLEAINAASAKEKSIRQGHPSSLHLWWSRKPLATCRAVLFASIVDDPSSRPEEFPTEEAQEKERQRLFRIIERLVLWENTNNEEVLNEARREIMKATDGHPPPVLDPFCGGGSIPLEAQRLGLEAHASDLNPVAVLITKALIEIPPKFAGMPPVNPEARKEMQKKIQGKDWPGASGLAEDVRYYGKWMREEARTRIGHLYPKAKLPNGGEATVIAWIWARTVKCPNPACGAMMPLVNSFALSTKRGKNAWIEPLVDQSVTPPKIGFIIQNGHGTIPSASKVGRGAKFQCVACGQSPLEDYIKAEGISGRMSKQLMTVVAESANGRIFLPPKKEYENNITQDESSWKPEFKLSGDRRAIWCPLYGLDTFDKLFTPRQLITLAVLSDLAIEVRNQVLQDALEAGLADDNLGLAKGGKGVWAYTDAIAVYMGIAVSRTANTLCSLAIWSRSREQSVNVFSRQALPMNWDFPEVNPFAGAAGDFGVTVESISKTILKLPSLGEGFVTQHDATDPINSSNPPLCSTDPPYYDNIGYADLADFFYVWLKHILSQPYQPIFSTLLSPKENELVAVPYRFNGDQNVAMHFFEQGLSKAFKNIRCIAGPIYPTTIYYAFKQSENTENTASTGWETMINGLIDSDFQIIGTWPMRTERPSGVKTLVNVLASSIVFVCRPRLEDATTVSRRDFISALRQEFPAALRQLQKGNIAPVDLAQAAIGPGMAIFSRYLKVLEADGSSMRVRTALQLINQHLDEYLSEQEGEYDPDTRWALSWFEQYGMNEGSFGDAETLSKAKNISVDGLVQSEILKAGGGKVRLLKREEMDPDWDPATDKRLSVWEMTQHLISILENNGEDAASELQHKLGGAAETARDLAYRLYAICERKGWSQEAISYNGLVIAWPRLRDLSAEKIKGSGQQALGAFE